MTVQDNRLRVAARPGVADAQPAHRPHAGARARRASSSGRRPSATREQDERIRELSNQFAHVATHRGVPFVADRRPLVATTPGAARRPPTTASHPGAGGYAALAEIVLAAGWTDWLDTLG